MGNPVLRTEPPIRWVAGFYFPVDKQRTLTGTVDMSAISGALSLDIAGLQRHFGKLGGLNPGSTDLTMSAPVGTDTIDYCLRPTDQTNFGLLQRLLGGQDDHLSGRAGTLNGGNSGRFTAADQQQLLRSPTRWNSVPGFSNQVALSLIPKCDMAAFLFRNIVATNLTVLPAAFTQNGGPTISSLLHT